MFTNTLNPHASELVIIMQHLVVQDLAFYHKLLISITYSVFYVHNPVGMHS